MMSERLVELRKQKRLTQADLADYLQISRQAYSFYELGKYEMDYTSLCKIADLYNVSTDYILGRTYDKPLLLDDDSEVKLIKSYRMLDERGKSAVQTVVEHEKTHCRNGKK